MFVIRQLDISMGNLCKWFLYIEYEIFIFLYFMNLEEMEFKLKFEY